MGYIVIAMPRAEDADRLKRMVERSGIWEKCLLCEGGRDVIRTMQRQEVSLIICSRKLKDMGYQELSSYMPAGLQMLMLVKDPSAYPFSGNIHLMQMPFKAEDLVRTLRELLPHAFYERKKKKSRRSPEEEALITAAKEMLMKERDMSEPDAFRFIQKSSMDTGRSLVESAKMVLLLYEKESVT